MDVFLAGTDSLKLTRIARQDPDLALVPAGTPIGMPTSLPWTSPPSGSPCRRLERVSPRGASLAHVLLARKPFVRRVRLVPGAPHPPPERLVSRGHPGQRRPLALCGKRRAPPVRRVPRTEPGSHGAAGPAARQARRPHAKRRFHQAAHVSHGGVRPVRPRPRRPAHGPCVFELEPIQPPEKIVELLNDLEGIRGLRRARHAASLVQSGAGSPEETLLSLAFKLPESLGGIEARPFWRTSPSTGRRRCVTSSSTGRCGRLQLARAPDRRGVQRQGHISEEAFEEDQRRIRDYQRCGISVFPASYKNVRTVHALNGYLASVAHSLAKTEGPEFEARVRRTLEDEGATHARKVLLSQTLPAIPSEKPCW